MTEAIWLSLFAAAVRMTTPYLLASLGETYSQKSGVMNIGLEGFMTAAAFAAYSAAHFSGNRWVGLAAGIGVCLLLGLFYGAMVIRLGVNQPIMGLSMNILLLASMSYFYRVLYGAASTLPNVTDPFVKQPIPLLSQIPWIGNILFNQYAFVYVAIIAAFAMAFYYNRTKGGIALIACGENPKAADTRAINVNRVRMKGVLVSAAFCGIAGAYLSTALYTQYTTDIVAARGYIAYSLVIFGQWDPKKLLAGSFLFGFLEALSLTLQAIGSPVPHTLLMMLPYVITIIALVLSTRNSRNARPACLAKLYKPSR